MAECGKCDDPKHAIGDHSGECQLEHYIAYHSGVIDKEDASELRRIVSVIANEATPAGVTG